jgi:hypothetical protein
MLKHFPGAFFSNYIIQYDNMIILKIEYYLIKLTKTYIIYIKLMSKKTKQIKYNVSKEFKPELDNKFSD